MGSRMVALSVSLALGAALVLPAASGAAAEPAADGVLPAAECKLASQIRSFNEGFPLDEDAAAATGTLTAQLIYAEFPDHAAGGADEFWFEHLRADAARAEANLEAQSGGRLDVVLREPADWITMPNDTTAYPESGDAGWGNRVFHEFVTDAVAAAEPTIDFTGADVVWVFYPWIAPLAARAQASNFVPLTVDGAGIRAITLPKAGSDAAIASVIVHETGHTFSLPDLYDAVATDGGASYFGSWDPMSDGWGDGVALEAWEFAGWHLWRLGWIDDDQVQCVAPGASLDVVLDGIVRRGSTVIAVVPTGEYRAVVVESRRAERFDASIPRPGVLVYVIDTAVESGDGPLRIGPRDGTAFPVDADGFANATLLVSDRYTDPVAGFSVTVTASTEASDRIRIEPSAAPTEPPGAPTDPSAAPAALPAAVLPPTGADPRGVAVGSVALLLAGFLAVSSASRRRTTSR